MLILAAFACLTGCVAQVGTEGKDGTNQEALVYGITDNGGGGGDNTGGGDRKAATLPMAGDQGGGITNPAVQVESGENEGPWPVPWKATTSSPANKDMK
jgi:hypothetical protein